MATAYAALTSLVNLLTQLHEHPQPPIQLDEKQVDSLSSNICDFQKILEDHHNTIDHGVDIRIASAARAVEDLIETHIADRIKGQLDLHRSPWNDIVVGIKEITRRITDKLSQGALQSPIKCLDSIMNDTSEILLKNKRSQGSNQLRQNLKPPLASSQSPSATSDEKIEVGIEEITNRIVDKLTPQYMSNRQIISISGMGGIGKTTLARNIYDHPCVKYYFDVCAWATISTYYNTCEILIELLQCLDRTISKEGLSNESEHKLGDKLYKSLIGRRYLVILDDVWHLEAWDRLRFFLPASSGSAIVTTTRETVVSSMISSYSFRMDFLDERKSWDLFCNRVFGKDSCPRELEDVGKCIANKCRGLPLSIVVIGGHLAKSPKTQAYWEYISDNLSSVVNSENDEHCLKLLSLSYMHLPVHLKPCFLYMGIFPEDKEIKIFEVIRLWMVEGILKPINGKSLEEAAEEYLHDLITRNLILASKLSKRGKIKSCKMHDLLRDFCIKREMEKNFFCIVQKQGIDILETRDDLRVSLSRSFCEPRPIRTLTYYCKSIFKSGNFFQQFPLGSLMTISENHTIEYSDIVNLQCLSIETYGHFLPYIWNIPRSHHFFWNLHYLVLNGQIKAPPEIWKMPQLRHIRIDNLHLLDPPSKSNIYILKNLQSAKTIENFTFSEDLVKRVPNIRRLKVRYDYKFKWADSFKNIARLEKLESFDCSFEQLFESFDSSFGQSISESSPRNNRLRDLTLPHSLKKLVFGNVHWDDVTTKIGSLPLLEALTMHGCKGREWNLVGGQFVRLKYLALEGCDDLECFTAGVNHFPCLETLFLHTMLSLKEISSDLGDIPTLRLIKLCYCPASAVVCAKRIANVQCENTGNEELQILHESSNLLAPPTSPRQTLGFALGDKTTSSSDTVAPQIRSIHEFQPEFGL